MFVSTSTSATNQYNSQDKEIPLTGFTVGHLDK